MKKKITLFLVIIGAIIAFLTDYLPKEQLRQTEANQTGAVVSADDILKVNYLDVGQGDSTFIELPNGETMLIDAGNPGDGEKVISAIEEKGYKKIDYLVATHPHSDHVGGMAEVVEGLEIGKVYMPKKSHSTASFEKMAGAISEKNLKISEAKAGVTVLEKDNLKIEILSPISSEYDDLNNYSAVVKIVYGENSFLFMGDAEKQVEYELMESGKALKSDVLKVGHHGSSTSSANKFIKAVKPLYAVISCGKDNDYGHPHKEVLEVLKKNQADALRTDESGTIVITSDGVNIQVEKSE